MHAIFYSYTDKELLDYNSAVTKLWLAGDESFRSAVIRSGEEMTFRGLW